MRYSVYGRIGCGAAALVLCACAAPRERAFERVAVAGASLSAGFALDVEVGRPVTLAEVLERTLTADHAPVTNAADIFFFMQPRKIGSAVMEKAAAARPTLLLALDFLFWYGYGAVGDESERLGNLEEGLKLLDGFSCPVVVGDLPDMSESIGKMLSAAQVPAPEMRARLNRRIREWAASRGATVVPLSETMERLRAGGEVRAGGRTYAGAASRALLQEDRLHPTIEGLACVTIMALDAFMEGRAKGYLDDPKTVASRLK